MKDLDRDIAASLLNELHNLLDKYDGMIMIGVLDLVKTQLLIDSLERADCDEEDDEQ